MISVLDSRKLQVKTIPRTYVSRSKLLVEQVPISVGHVVYGKVSQGGRLEPPSYHHQDYKQAHHDKSKQHDASYPPLLHNETCDTVLFLIILDVYVVAFALHLQHGSRGYQRADALVNRAVGVLESNSIGCLMTGYVYAFHFCSPLPEPDVF